MLNISFETNLTACRNLWEELVPAEKITDLWDVRMCFHEHFKRKPYFVVARENNQIKGFIPLCFIEENNYYGYFPGEIWQGKTWLEQNRLIAENEDVLIQMFRWLRDNNINYHLRYLSTNHNMVGNLASEDEIGYLFFPPLFNYSLEEYYSAFSKKSIKTIRREVNKMYERNVVIKYDEADAFEEMVSLNIGRFGKDSYFADAQFAESFRDLKNYFEAKGWLRMTSVFIEDRLAAVDMGCVYNGDYTLLAGGTHSDFPGVAKVINLHHIKLACENKYNSADFLCGDFSWKKIFHLSENPLFKVSSVMSAVHV